MKLYDIDAALRELGGMLDAGVAEAVDGETGEIIDIAAALEAMQIERERKIDGVACMVKEMMAEVAAIANERRALAARQDAKDRQLDALRAWLQAALTDDTGTARPFESPRTVIRFRRVKTVQVDGGAALPLEYQRIKTTIEPDKAALREALKAGQVIPGAALVERQSMTVK